jgi:tetratricopeptide (TPR) repeat protein
VTERPILRHAYIALLVCGTACSRDTTPADPAAHDAGMAAPAARTALLEKLGPYHRTIRTNSAQAQQFFDEGLTLLYGFNHEEAMASFARAAALDTLSPMPHWGMALSLGTNINDPAPADRLAKAFTHLAQAARRAANGSEVEQGLVAALGTRYVANPTGDQSVRETAYADAMGALAARFPDDADVGALHAESLMNRHPWRLYTADGTPEAWTPPIVAQLERVLARHPEHPGANHYYIHAIEASKAPERASQSARRLETLVPGAGHLVHMPSHIYIRTGDYARSAKANAAAAAVDEAYFGPNGAPTFYAMSYYSHNLQFESASAMFAGNLAEARASAARTVKVSDPVADQMAMLEPFAALELFVLVRFGQWTDILANATQPPTATRTLQTGFFHWARGAALAATGQAPNAEQALAALQRTARGVPKDAMVGPVNWGGDVLAVAIADLTGRIAEAKGDHTGAIAAFTDAVAAEDKLGYNEPPDWLLPERERLGVALLSTGRATEAEAVFRAELAKHRQNPRALFGVWKSLQVQRRDTTEAHRAFTAAWSGADITLGDDLYPKR